MAVTSLNSLQEPILPRQHVCTSRTAEAVPFMLLRVKKHTQKRLYTMYLQELAHKKPRWKPVCTKSQDAPLHYITMCTLSLLRAGEW